MQYIVEILSYSRHNSICCIYFRKSLISTVMGFLEHCETGFFCRNQVKKRDPTVFGETNTTDTVHVQEKMQHLPVSHLPHGSNAVGLKDDRERMQQIRGAGAVGGSCRDQ